MSIGMRTILLILLGIAIVTDVIGKEYIGATIMGMLFIIHSVMLGVDIILKELKEKNHE